MGVLFLPSDTEGKRLVLAKAEILSENHGSGSIMPQGIEKSLSVDEFVDLIAFLTSQQ